LEPVHEAHFRIRAPGELAGTVVQGWVRIWCGPVIIGEASVAIAVDPVGAEQVVATPEPERLVRYRKIFPSYSHADSSVVEPFAVVARAEGDEFFQDVLTLRSGEEWNRRLLGLIDEADVFQLFWSSNSLHSSHCRREWEKALALHRPGFIKPVYWEEPLPEAPALGLPPEGLRCLHFVRLPEIRVTYPTTAQWLVVVGPPTLEGQLMILTEGLTTVGRGQVDMRLNHPGVSPVHAALLASGGHVTVHDLGSTAGTTVNGQPVHASQPLRSGDILGFGPVQVRVVIPSRTRANVRPERSYGQSSSFTIREQAADQISNVGRDQ
jgi:hypothetical protein